jgi:hypothetical protein
VRPCDFVDGQARKPIPLYESEGCHAPLKQNQMHWQRRKLDGASVDLTAANSLAVVAYGPLRDDSRRVLTPAFCTDLKKLQHALPGIETGSGIGLRGATHIEQVRGGAFYA